ncbi:MAG: YraN family protein [Bacteroidia bacterium]
MTEHHHTGKKGEQEAIRFLRGNGYDILHTNWTYLHLEIDIVAKKGEELVIAEVKTRSTDAFGEPETFVSKKKQRNLIKAANYYLEMHHLNAEVRFDVIGIVKKGAETVIHHIPGAFHPLEV